MDGEVSMIKPNGQMAWSKTIGGSDNDSIIGVVPINDAQAIAVGHTFSNNGDVSGNHGGSDIWLVKLSYGNTITANVFIDYNRNGTRDPTEPLANGYLVESQKGQSKAGSLTVNGAVSHLVDTGTYVTTVITAGSYFTPVPASVSSNFTTYSNTKNIAFALQPIAGKRDYKLNLHSSSRHRPNGQVFYNLTYTNVGTDTLQNRTLKLVKDSRMSFIGADLPPVSIVGDTMTWVVSNLFPGQMANIEVKLKLGVPPVVNLGDQLNSWAVIDSTGDLVPANNIAYLQRVVTAAVDPNDKQESQNGTIFGADAASKDLTYTIRFQNTGNDTAFLVVVRDTLSAKLDWSSVQMLSATHDYKFEIKNGNQLTWTFDNILLVDSVHNEPLSHGYITYSIRPKAGIATGDTIRNSASIYFDFNLPVKTNTHVTVVRPLQVPQPLITGMATAYCSTQGLQKIKIANLPAQGSGIAVTAMLDGNVLSIAADSSVSFDVNTLSAGSHVLNVTYASSSDSKTASFNFNVAIAVSPDVSVSANNITVINLLDPLVITASNAAGGGSSPLYTFGKDRSFSNLLQPESSNNIFNTTGGNLQTGDNWIYVRMKTSLTCYTQQTAIASITIAKYGASGLTDPDFPNQTISANPNPFKSQLTVNGLSASKTYTIIIHNSRGMEVYRRKVAGRNSTALNTPGQVAGTYTVSIYDQTKNRLIGTIAVVKQ